MKVFKHFLPHDKNIILHVFHFEELRGVGAKNVGDKLRFMLAHVKISFFFFF